ncbi:MAG TPA: homoserine O-acetyltransferase [Chromatiales bacterium]|nr:homoserine O-acetyltransferase [Chromatiales bacterium]
MSTAVRIHTPPTHVPPATRLVALPGPFRMRRGGTLPLVHIACERWGELAPSRDNVVLLFTGLSPSAHAASSPEDPTPGWWEYMIGPGRPIDTRRWHVVCVNSLGSCFGSTGPASPDPRTGEPYRLRFPELSIEDIARSAREALRVLGIERVHTVVGASLGGMAALAYAMEFPDEVERLVAISAAARATPFAIAIRSLQREIIRSDPAWRGGDYPPGQGPRVGMRLARKLGLMSYRSAQEWLARFGRERLPEADAAREPFGPEFQIESYLEHNARKFVERFDANCYLYLSRSMDLFDAAEHGAGSVERALARVRARRALVVGVETDFLFPLFQQEELAEGLRAAGCEVRFEALPSIQGHDAFLVDEARFAPVVARFMEAR